MSLKFVLRGPINNIQALVLILFVAVQATSHYQNQWWLVYWRIYASLDLNELAKEVLAQKLYKIYIITNYHFVIVQICIIIFI